MKRFVVFVLSMIYGVSVFSDTFFVSTNSVSDGPGTVWSNAFHTIQGAVDAAASNDTVLVTNGVYDAGGIPAPGYALTNRVCVTKVITIESVNGPTNTFIVGAGPKGDAAIRGVYLGDHAVLSGFTVTNGYTRTSGSMEDQCGGGGWCGPDSLITNCVLIDNTADSYGGGVRYGTLVDCMLSGNLAERGGGSSDSTLNDCTLNGNTASSRGAGVYRGMLNNCTLSGNHASYSGGGATESTLTDCILTDNYGRTYGGGTEYGTLTRCTLSGGSSEKGGGAFRDTLTDCILTNNTASFYGGGIYEGELNNCMVVDNTASSRGGGSYKTTVTDCFLTGNSAAHGAGAQGGTLSYCTFVDNVATGDGGGVRYGTLNHCLLINNTASGKGGGSLGAALKNCTVSGNASDTEGGGTHGGSLVNCIVYDNDAPIGTNCYLPGSVSFSCITPDPGGVSNITVNPLFVIETADNYHLQTGSPCIDSGTNTNLALRDLDGVPLPVDGNESGTAMVDMGCYEYLNPASDYDLDTIPNGWETDHNLNPSVDDRAGNLDHDSFDNLEEYIADTDPTDPDDYFHITGSNGDTVAFDSSSDRLYTILGCTNLVSNVWNPVSGPRMGIGGADSITSTNSLPVEFYKLTVELP